MTSTRTIRTIRTAAAFAAVLVVVGCGGADGDTAPGAVGEPAIDDTSDDTTDDSADDVSDEPAPESTVPDDDTSDGTSDDTPDDASDDGTYEPGEVGYRVVNLTDRSFDLWVRTQGLVRAFEAELAVPPGAVTDFFRPPVDGTFVVSEVGGDPSCVGGCDHLVATLTAFPSDGTVHTVLLYDADGDVATFDLWEDPVSGSGSANAMVAADPTAGSFVVTAVDLTDADFGLRLGLDVTGGCVEPVNSTNILVGGNQTPAFAYDGASATVVFYDNQDLECSGETVGGPFTVSGGPGARSHLLLTGSPGSMDAIVVPFANTGATDALDGASSG